MLKALALLRTLFLVFIVGYTVRAMPWYTSMAKTHDESFARCSSDLQLMIFAAWLAVAWIGLETAFGWWTAIRRGRKAAQAKAVPTSPPGP
jgi:hypothetical protein